MSSGNIVLPSEACHWYLPSGAPYYTVPRSDGQGTRNATITDAKKVGAAPSVTTITKVIDKPQLNNYHERGIFDATLDLQWQPGDDSNKLFAKAKEVSRRRGREAAERGDAIHEAVEKSLLAEDYDQKWAKYVEAVWRAHVITGSILEAAIPENSFFSPMGYGGKVDYHDPFKIVDYKTKDKYEAGKQYAYEEHSMQLAAYRLGLFPHLDPDKLSEIACWNFFIFEADGSVMPYQHREEDLQQGWMMFKFLLGYWRAWKNYYPGGKGKHE